MRATIVIPSVNVYRHKQSGRYLVQELMASPSGGSVECGQPTTIEEGAFESQVAQLILSALANYEKRTYSADLERRFQNDRKSLTFAKEHLVVNVARIPGNRIRVAALKRRGAGHAGVVGGDTVIDATAAPRDLPGVLLEAFEKAQ